MYRLGHRIRRHYRLYIIFALLIICLGLIVVVSERLLVSNTDLKQSNPINSYYSVTSGATEFISEPAFTIDLPAGWHSVPSLGSPYNVYSWQGTGSDIDRHLDIYIDKVPTGLAVNRLLPVQSFGIHLNVIGNVSDKCTNFTTSSSEIASTGTAAAEWDGIKFVCDMANYERDVVAIGSTEGVNGVTMVNAKGQQHQVLLVYTDNSSSPDFTIFSSMIESFRLH